MPTITVKCVDSFGKIQAIEHFSYRPVFFIFGFLQQSSYRHFLFYLYITPLVLLLWWVSIIDLPITPSIMLMCLLLKWWFWRIFTPPNLRSIELYLCSVNLLLRAFFIQCIGEEATARQYAGSYKKSSQLKSFKHRKTLWAHQFCREDYRRLVALLELYASAQAREQGRCVWVYTRHY